MKLYRKEVDHLQEVWKEIDGYGGRYKVSDRGRIKSYAQDRRKGKIKYGHPSHKGYLHILLYDGKGGSKWYPIHRLVASAFLENPENLPQVNHKDEDKLNNQVDNLEWCTGNYNITYGTRSERAAEANRCCKTTSVKIYSIDEMGRVDYYDSIGEAERQTGCSHSNIIAALKERRNHCGKKQWFYC